MTGEFHHKDTTTGTTLKRADWEDVNSHIADNQEQGDVLYFNGTSWVVLHHGTAGDFLKSGGNSADPSWQSPDNTAGGTDGSLVPITSNVHYDHCNAADPHTGYMLESNIGLADNKYPEVDDASGISDNDYVKATATGLEGRTYAEVKSDLDLEINTDLLTLEAITTTQHYTGFPDRTATSLTWSDGDIKLTLTATSDPIWINGVKYVINTLDKVLTDATGLYWCWITAPGGTPQLNASTDHPGFGVCLVATVYWNTTTDKGIMCDERHWMGRDTWMHEYLHETVGARYFNGMAITPTSTTFSIDGGEFYDEDIEHTITGAKTSCRILYKNGSANWEWDAGAVNLYKLNGTAMRYNNGNALTNCSTGDHVAMWVFATNDATYPYHVIIGQRVDTTIANARVNAVPSALSYGNLPSAEMKLLYRVIFRQNVSSVTYMETADYRAVSNLPVSNYTATDHSALSNLSVGDDHPQYLLKADIDDTPVDGETAAPISSNYMYDHVAAADPHTGYVLESLYDANTIIAANADNTPAAVTINEQHLVGRVTGGNISEVDIGIGDDDILQVDGTVEDNDFLKATATGVEGRSYSEVRSDLDLEAGTDFPSLTTFNDHSARHLVGAADTIFPADPGADKVLGWDDDPGELKWVDAPAGGNITTDGAWAAKGDLIVGTGENTAAILTVGTNGKYLKAASGEVTGLIWDTPAGSGDFKADGSVPLTGDIDFAGTQQCHDLQAPAANGEAIRQTAKITEAKLESATDNDVSVLLTERGSIIYRGASAPAELKHGTSGQYLKTMGDGADPVWADVSASGADLDAQTLAWLGV